LSSAIGQGAVAIGNAAIAGTNGVAIGNGASTGAFANSVAIGAGSVNTAANQVQMGGRVVSGVADGIAPTDAANVGQLNAVAGNIGAMQGDIGVLQGDVATLFDLRKEDRQDMKQGVASAMAMAQAPMPSS